MTTRQDKGFTLIEVILSLVVSSILAVMLSTYLGASLTKSNDPLTRLRKTLKIYSVMENIHISYESSAESLTTLQTNVGVPGNTYSNSYGIYNVKYNNYVSCNALLTNTFTGPSGTTILMITISDPDILGITVTSLFAK